VRNSNSGIRTWSSHPPDRHSRRHRLSSTHHFWLRIGTDRRHRLWSTPRPQEIHFLPYLHIWGPVRILSLSMGGCGHILGFQKSPYIRLQALQSSGWYLIRWLSHTQISIVSPCDFGPNNCENCMDCTDRNRLYSLASIFLIWWWPICPRARGF
jgi:hypothetical protein